jgi:hypothetical protein
MFSSQALDFSHKTNAIKSVQEVINELLAANYLLTASLNQANLVMTVQNNKLAVQDGIIRSHSELLAEAKQQNQRLEDEIEAVRVVSNSITSTQGQKIRDQIKEIKELQDKLIEIENKNEEESVYLLQQPLTNNSLFKRR